MRKKPKFTHTYHLGDEIVYEVHASRPTVVGEVVTNKEGEQFEVTGGKQEVGGSYHYSVLKLADTVHELVGPFFEGVRRCSDGRCYYIPSQRYHLPIKVSREFYDAYLDEFYWLDPNNPETK